MITEKSLYRAIRRYTSYFIRCIDGASIEAPRTVELGNIRCGGVVKSSRDHKDWHTFNRCNVREVLRLRSNVVSTPR